MKKEDGISINYSFSMENANQQYVKIRVDIPKEVLIEAGASKIYAHGPVRNTGWHIMGTAKMGNNPKSSVVNKSGRAHDVNGLYIVDSSCFVTSSCVNPAGAASSVSASGMDSIATSPATAKESTATESASSIATSSLGSCEMFVLAHNIDCDITVLRNNKSDNRFMIEIIVL